MAIAFNAATNSTYKTATSSFSWSHMASGANLFAAVDVAILNASGVSVTGVTYGGVAASLIGAKSNTLGTYTVECWGLVNPATAVQTVAITLSGSADAVGMAATYTGVDQTTPTEAYDSNQGTNVGANDATCTTALALSTWARLAIATSDGSITALETGRNNVSGANGSGADSDTTGFGTGGSISMGYTDVGAGQTWAVGEYGMIPFVPPPPLVPLFDMVTAPSKTSGTQIVFY